MSLTSKEAIKIIIGSEFLVGLEACTTAAEDDDASGRYKMHMNSSKLMHKTGTFLIEIACIPIQSVTPLMQKKTVKNPIN